MFAVENSNVPSSLEQPLSLLASFVPVKVLSVGPGQEVDTFCVVIELHRSAAEWLARVAARFYPIYEEVEKERERERERAERHVNIEARLDRVRLAGRCAFHRVRKVPIEEKSEALEVVAARFDLPTAAVAYAASQHGKRFLAEVRRRRTTRIVRLFRQGLARREIAARMNVCATTVAVAVRESEGAAC